MTTNWQLPEGVEEALPHEAQRLEAVRRQMIDTYRSWGYELVMPPFIEYLDSLLVDSPKLDVQTFKITDQLTGKMMGIRADMTPQIARIDAHRLKSEGPSRLCYMGTVLKTRPDNFAGSRSPLQFGVELYGHNGLEGDLEVIKLMLKSMDICDIDSLHLDLGHVGIFREISHLGDLTSSQENVLFDMLQRKSIPEIEAYLETLDCDESILRAISLLPKLSGDSQIISEARQYDIFSSGKIADYLSDLEQLGKLISKDYPQLEVHYDLAELCGYRYKTGMVYALYTPGEGRELARGGRYDGIGEAFGNARPATGFSADLKNLLRLTDATSADVKQIIYASVEVDSNVIDELREQGQVVITALGERDCHPAEYGCTHELTQRDERWVVKKLGR